MKRGPLPSPDFERQVKKTDIAGEFEDAIIADITNLSAVVDALALLAGTQVMTASGIATGSTADLIAHGANIYIIDGVQYYLAANAAGVAWAGGEVAVPQNTHGAFRLEVGADGTLDIVEAADNVTGYASAVLALAGLPAIQADHVSLGTVTVVNTAAAFTPDTTEFSAGTVTAVYAEPETVFESLVAALPTIVIPSPSC